MKRDEIFMTLLEMVIKENKRLQAENKLLQEDLDNKEIGTQFDVRV